MEPPSGFSLGFFVRKKTRGQYVLLKVGEKKKILFLSLQRLPMPTTVPVALGKVTPSASSQLNLLARTSILSLSQVDWSWNPQGNWKRE